MRWDMQHFDFHVDDVAWFDRHRLICIQDVGMAVACSRDADQMTGIRGPTGVLAPDVANSDGGRECDFQFIKAVPCLLQFLGDVPLERSFDFLDLELQVSRLLLQPRDVRQQAPDGGFLVRLKNPVLEIVVLGSKPSFDKRAIAVDLLSDHIKLLLFYVALLGIGIDLLLQMRLLRAKYLDLALERSTMSEENVLFLLNDFLAVIALGRIGKGRRRKGIFPVQFSLKSSFTHEQCALLLGQLTYALFSREKFGNGRLPQCFAGAEPSGKSYGTLDGAAETKGVGARHAHISNHEKRAQLGEAHAYRRLAQNAFGEPVADPGLAFGHGQILDLNVIDQRKGNRAGLVDDRVTRQIRLAEYGYSDAITGSQAIGATIDSLS